MNGKLARMLAIVIAVVWACSALAQDKDWGPFDRLLVTQKFLDAVYPDLKHVEGALILHAVEFHAATGQGNQIDLVPCHPGSGIVTYSNLAPGQEPPPNCGSGGFPSPFSDFLTLSVIFSIKYPLRSFGAGGSFLQAKSDPVKKQIVAHPEWDEQQRIKALQAAHPRFGVDDKQELISSIPSDALFRFTGCKLQLDSATLFATRDELKPYPPSSQVGWHVSGYHPDAVKDSGDRCSAIFEPFDGRLLQIGNF
jgi:hypothetical protein